MTTPLPLRNRHTASLRHGFLRMFDNTLRQIADAVAERHWTVAGVHTRQLRDDCGLVRDAFVRDALDAGLDWWAIGEHLNLHPQDAWELYQSATPSTVPPREQRPHLAIQLCAGVDALHDFEFAYGADIADLKTGHSVQCEPTVERLREASVLLRADIWIAVNLPGQTMPNHDSGLVSHSWASVVHDNTDIAAIHNALAAPRFEPGCRCHSNASSSTATQPEPT